MAFLCFWTSLISRTKLNLLNQCWIVSRYQFHTTSLFLYSLETWENQRFSNTFREYRKRSVAWNGLTVKQLRFVNSNLYEIHTLSSSVCVFIIANVIPSLLYKSLNFNAVSLEIAVIRVTFVILKRLMFMNGFVSPSWKRSDCCSLIITIIL